MTDDYHDRQCDWVVQREHVMRMLDEIKHDIATIDKSSKAMHRRFDELKLVMAEEKGARDAHDLPPRVRSLEIWKWGFAGALGLLSAAATTALAWLSSNIAFKQ